ncbi:MAG: adenosine kinase [Acidimicrobiales bacterium]
MLDAIPGASDNGAVGVTYDVVAVGNALVDVLAHANDEFLAAQQLHKGAMRLIDAEEAERLYAAMGPGVEASGGSVANTAVGVASFGGRAAYIGKVRDDQLGRIFQHDIRAIGVDFEVPLAPHGPPTGRCLIVVTPDAERTMNTFLGIAAILAPDDIDTEVIAQAQITYCEGYLWDVDIAKQAIRAAMDAAHSSGRKVALSLSDGFCVDRHRDEFRDLVAQRVDILLGNENEICSLYETDGCDDAVQRVRGRCELAFITRGPRGSVVVAGDDVHLVDSHPAEFIVDKTGAGDMYAAGVLYGLTHQYDVVTAAKLGSMAASEVIGHFGPRPLVALADLAHATLA